MYTDLERLSLLLTYLSEAMELQKQPSVIAEQVLKAEDINLGDNAQLNIQQNQYIIIHQADKWLNEAKQITHSLLEIMPSPELPLPEAVKLFKRAIVTKALEKTNGHRTKAANLIGMKRSNLHYLMGDKKEVI